MLVDRVLLVALAVSLSFGCDDSATGDPDASTADGGGVDAGNADAGDGADSGPTDAGPTDAGPTDAGTPAPPIRDVLGECERPGSAGGVAGGMDMLRQDIDLTRFPEALCNDGTGAVFYVRRHSNMANQNRWHIHLIGGGGCQTPDRCSARFCAAGTPLAAQKMSSNYAPAEGARGVGMYSTDPRNPIAGWNHALLYYCSSDNYAGTLTNVDVVSEHPTNPGEEVRYRIHFAGAHIFDALIDTLRRTDGSTVSYTDPTGGMVRELPDLDDAEMVVLAGASAGSGGVTNNIDRLAESLRTNNTNCMGGGPCPLRVIGVHDSGYAPAREQLDLSTTPFCTEEGTCDWDAFNDESSDRISSMRGDRLDESCGTWHETNDPTHASRCIDNTFVLENHITTPLFVRMDQTDGLNSDNFTMMMYGVPGMGLITPALFETLVRRQMMELTDIQSTANEGSSITVVPGIFSPSCGQHETLRNNAAYRDVLVNVGGTDYNFPTVMMNWIRGDSPSVAVSDGTTHTCP